LEVLMGFDMNSVNGVLEQFGGLDGITEKLQESGLDDQLSSWIGKGDNLPVSADQIKGALSKSGLDEIAGKLGVDSDELAGKISEFLPDAVDKATPDGTVPAGGFNMGTVTNLLGSLTGDK
jgi:uncharacterized protein YidB (DUF937 family)